jgi:Carboxypeptidase regulatory-like domain/Secretion system C-terminal sorting domain
MKALFLETGCRPIYFCFSKSKYFMKFMVLFFAAFTTYAASAQNGFIGGTVAGSDKTPAAHVQVTLRNALNEAVAFAYTDNNGSYSFTNLTTGTYNVYPQTEGYNVVASGDYTLTADHSSLSGVDFTANNDVKTIAPALAAVEEALAQPATLSMKKDNNGININWQVATNQSATVHIVDADGKEVFASSINMAGNGNTTLNVSNLKTGRYIISIQSTDVNFNSRLTI